MKKVISFVLLMIISTPLFAQEQPEFHNFELRVVKADQPITIDGVLNEDIWKSAAVTSDFLNKYPFDTGLAVNQTVARVTYDDENLYVGAIAYQKKENIIVKTLKRDHPDHLWNSESFIITIDPFNRQTNGFIFLVSAAGVQSEGVIKLENSRARGDFNWNNVWTSKVNVYDNYWVAEVKIPLKSINFDPDVDTWGINFLRKDMHENVWSSWRHIPIAFNAMDLGHQGEMVLDESLDKQKQRILFQPYILASGNQNFEDSEDFSSNFEIGLDAKIPISSTLKMDLTVNPDFSTVDVDQQVTNLTRFSISFPEKRAFFLENSDLFTSFGTWGIQPFFSRRIGLNDGELVPILFGARMTGNISEGTRVGVLNVQTRSMDQLAANNYSVAAIQQNVVGRTNVKALITNRSAFDGTGSTKEDFNRTMGMELNYTSENGVLNGNLRYHYSQTEENLDDASFAGATLMFDDGNMGAGITYDYVGDNFINEMGFSQRSYQYDAARDSLVRVGFRYMNPWISKTFRPESSWMNFLDIGFWTLMSWENNSELIDRWYTFFATLNTRQLGMLDFSYRFGHERLLFPTDLIGGEDFLPAETFHYSFANLNYQTDARGVLNGGFNASYGGFYNGTRLRLGGNLNVRAQPWGNFGVSYLMNKVDLPGNYGQRVLHLIGPQTEISFSKDLNWTTFLQYNTQADNFNVNSRLQWRYAPMSDLFLVFNDNYNTDDFLVKNRGVVLKMNYWFN